MARISGRRGRVYMGATNGTAAIPVTAQATWDINFTQDSLDVTAMGDTTKQYVAGLPDAGGSFSGFHDDVDTGSQIYAAATDGLSRKFYLYPDLSSATKYYYGDVVVSDFTSSGGVDGAVTSAVTWKGNTAITFKYS